MLPKGFGRPLAGEVRSRWERRASDQDREPVRDVLEPSYNVSGRSMLGESSATIFMRRSDPASARKRHHIELLHWRAGLLPSIHRSASYATFVSHNFTGDPPWVHNLHLDAHDCPSACPVSFPE